MPHRRQLLAGLSAIAVSLLAGCPNSVTGGFRDGQGSLAAEKRDILELYESGTDAFNAGLEAREGSIAAFNEPDYGTAITRSDDVIERSEAAR